MCSWPWRLRAGCLHAAAPRQPGGPAGGLSTPSRRCPHHDALVVVRTRRGQAGTRTRDAHDEGRRHRRASKCSRCIRSKLEGNFPYLSPEFLDDLKFTAEKARELGLRFDLTLGSGWPFGGPHIPITEAAARLRVDRVPVPPNATSVPLPAIGEGEKFLAAFLARGDRGSSRPKASNAERSRQRGAGAAEAGEGRVVLFFIESRTRQTVKRPSMGAEGWVLDHYDRKAVDTHLNAVGEKLLGALGKDLPYAIFSDSLEVYNSDWTPGLLEEFRKRRGYDLMPYLPGPGRRHGRQDGRHPPRLGQDADGTVRGAVPQAADRMGAPPRHEIPLADLWHPAGDAVEPGAGRPARRRGHRSGGTFRPPGGRHRRTICTAGR